MATAIRAIPTLYGETAKTFESEATLTEQNPGTEDYRHEAQVVADFLKTCTALWLLGTSKDFAGKGYGTAIMDFIKVLFRTNNRTGCRFLIVDALNRPDTLHYYEKNGFRYLIADERLEAKYMGIGVGHLPLNTRLMYFDLLKLKVNS